MSVDLGMGKERKVPAFNKSEAYAMLKQLLIQLYGEQGSTITIVSQSATEIVLSIPGTSGTITLKRLPGSGEQGDVLYCNASGNWVSLVHGDAHAPLVTGGHGANPSWGDEIYLKPKASSTGPEGTMFYNSADNGVYVGVE